MQFVHGDDMLEKKLHFNANTSCSGGWRVGASFLLEAFGYDPALYANRYIVRTLGARSDTVPFVGLQRITNRDYVAVTDDAELPDALGEPQYISGSRRELLRVGAGEHRLVDGRPRLAPDASSFASTARTCGNGTDAPTDGIAGRRDAHPAHPGRVPVSRVAVRARARRVSRGLRRRSARRRRLREPDSLQTSARLRAGARLLDGDGAGEVTSTRSGRRDCSRTCRAGDRVFVGYGSTLSEPQQLRFAQFDRVRDAFFVKMSYLWRRV